MYKKWLSYITLTIVMVMSIFIVMPQSAWAVTSGASGVFDDGNLLTDEEEANLLDKLNSYVEKYEADIAIVTTQSTNGQTTQAYADAYAEKIGQSMNRYEAPGILFLIDMDNRQIYIATQGQAIDYYSTERIDNVLDDCYDCIVEQDYAGTCHAFLNGVRKYMGVPIGKSARMGVLGVLIRLVISLVIGAGITAVMVRKRGGSITTSGATYFNAAQSHVDAHTDRFMHKTVTTRHIPKPQSGGGSSGGGGGVHMSSGGGTHGGGGRSF